MNRSHAFLTTDAPGSTLSLQSAVFQSAQETSSDHGSQQDAINPALLQAVDVHDQHSDVASTSSSESSLSDLESSNWESSPDPFELTNCRQSADQIVFGDEELIDLASHGTPAATAAVVDSTQQNLYLSLFEGIDVFAPASGAFDPPTPILAPDVSPLTEDAANPHDKNPDIHDTVQSSTTSQPQLQVIERLDKLINLQSQVLCVNLLTFGMLFRVRSQDSDESTIPVTEN